MLIFKLFDLMQNKLGLGTSVNSEELIKSGIGNRITVLMILDKLYSIFKNNSINGNLKRLDLYLIFLLLIS